MAPERSNGPFGAFFCFQWSKITQNSGVLFGVLYVAKKSKKGAPGGNRTKCIMDQCSFEAEVDYCGREYGTYILHAIREDGNEAVMRVIFGK